MLLVVHLVMVIIHQRVLHAMINSLFSVQFVSLVTAPVLLAIHLIQVFAFHALKPMLLEQILHVFDVTSNIANSVITLANARSVSMVILSFQEEQYASNV